MCARQREKLSFIITTYRIFNVKNIVFILLWLIKVKVKKNKTLVKTKENEINMLPSMFTCGSSTCSKSGLVQAKLLVTAF